jgi:hypothetical protein
VSVILLAWFANVILWICGNRRHKDKGLTEEDIESGSRASPSQGGVDYYNPSKEQNKPTIEELQASI